MPILFRSDGIYGNESDGSTERGAEFKYVPGTNLAFFLNLTNIARSVVGTDLNSAHRSVPLSDSFMEIYSNLKLEQMYGIEICISKIFIHRGQLN